MNKVGILILNHDGRDWLPTAYDSIFAQGFRETAVYLVDNDSKDDSVELTRDKYPEITVIRMPRNLGYSMAYNLAMPHAFADGCDWVIWANSDIRIEPGCLRELTRAAQGYQRIGVLGPAFLAWESNEPNYYIFGNHPRAIPEIEACSREPIDVAWVEGSLLMVRRECVETVGPLDPYFFMYWEEADFCRRARSEGWRVVLIPSALARHYGGGSSSNGREIGKLTNSLRLRNYYVYKLTDPFKHFAVNILEALHLFLVTAKQSLAGEPRAFHFNIKVFIGILKDFRKIYRKWARDRLGKHPPDLQEGILPVEPEIIHGKSGDDSTLRHDRAKGL